MLSLKTINASALYSMKRLGDMQSGLSDSVEKLSSGLRVNHARDDAARLRIGLDLQRQVKTLDAAVKNTMNAISMAQTADGALAGISDALIRLKGLAVQGRDGALSTTQLKSIADEMEQIRREVNSIANRTTFNSRRLLTDEFGQWLSVIPDEVLDANWDGEYSDTDTVKVVITADGTDQVRLFEGNATNAAAAGNGLTVISGYKLDDGSTAETKTSWASGQIDIAFSGTWANVKNALRDLELKRTTGNGIVDVQVIPTTMNVYTQNGVTSYYYVESTLKTWANARSSALASNFRGLDGYLANITSAGENTFIVQKTGADAWIGGSDDPTYAGTGNPEGYYEWVDGPESGVRFLSGNAGGSTTSSSAGVTVSGIYSNFNTGEPNDDGNEDYVQLYSSGGTAGKWNDLGSAHTLGYVIEYGGTAGAASIAGKQFAIDWAPYIAGEDPTFQVGAFTKSTYTASAFRDARIATNNRDTAAGDTFQDLATRILDIVNTASSRTSSNFAKISNLVDDVVTEIAARRTALGSMQNRLLATIENDNRQSEGLQQSKSMVVKTDFAAETARLTRMQIGQQAATAALAQANAMPNVVLALLK